MLFYLRKRSKKAKSNGIPGCPQHITVDVTRTICFPTQVKTSGIWNV